MGCAWCDLKQRLEEEERYMELMGWDTMRAGKLILESFSGSS